MNKMKKIVIGIGIISVVFLSIVTYFNSQIILEINGQRIIIYKDTKEINMEEYNQYEHLRITKMSNLLNLKINNQKIKKNRTIDLGYQKIENNNYKTFEISYITGKKRKIKLNILPNNFPKIESKGKSIYAGDYFLTTHSKYINGNHYIYNINEEGNIIYYKRLKNMVQKFKKNINTHNEIRYTFIEMKNLDNGELVILDENYKEIIRETNYKAIDYIYIDDNNYIVLEKNNINYIYKSKIKWKLQYKNHVSSIYKNNNDLLITFRETKEIICFDIKQNKMKWKINNKIIKEIVDPQYVLKNKNSIIVLDGGKKKSSIISIKLDKNNKVKSTKKYNLEIKIKDYGYIEHINKDVYLISYGKNDKERAILEEIDINNKKKNQTITIENDFIINVNKKI